jgi:hypothetical protein
MNSELGLKAPKRPVFVEFPVTKTAVLKKYGWKLRAAKPKPDYESRNKRVQRWRKMPEIDTLLEFALVKPPTGPWSEIAIVPVKAQQHTIVTGPRKALEALVRAFLANAASIPLGREKEWLLNQWGKAVAS